MISSQADTYEKFKSLTQQKQNLNTQLKNIQGLEQSQKQNEDITQHEASFLSGIDYSQELSNANN